MKKYVTIAKIMIIFLAVIIITFCVSYLIGISPVSKNSEEVTIYIANDSGYLGLSKLLKENDLIRSELFYKLYVKIFNPKNLQAGTYILNKNMGVEKIIEHLENSETLFENLIIPEGKDLSYVADMLSKKIDITKEEAIKYWNSEELLDKLIEKYWFITDKVKSDGLRNSLEGYFFPDTYSITKESTIEVITYQMLDRMEQILDKYKDEIEKSDFDVHEILTLASIIEHEAILDEDRPKIAGVFINRLNINQKLQSCATVGYAINQWKEIYNNSDLTFDSPYNTYVYSGLPVGPVSLAGEKSINAVLNPTKHNYYYFLANIYDSNDNQSHYAETYPQHQQNCLNYLGKEC